MRCARTTAGAGLKAWHAGAGVLNATQRPAGVLNATQRSAGVLNATRRPAGVLNATQRPAGALDATHLQACLRTCRGGRAVTLRPPSSPTAPRPGGHGNRGTLTLQRARTYTHHPHGRGWDTCRVKGVPADVGPAACSPSPTPSHHTHTVGWGACLPVLAHNMRLLVCMQ